MSAAAEADDPGVGPAVPFGEPLRVWFKIGLSRMFADDLDQLKAGLTLYDAFYRWCRDATGETHNWPSARPKA